MCGAVPLVFRKDEKELLLESVDLMESEEGRGIRMLNIFVEQKIITGKL